MECFDGQTHLMIENESFWRGHLKNNRIECQVDGDELQQTVFCLQIFSPWFHTSAITPHF